MPRGKYVNHKGRSRHFTSPEELEEERKKALKKKLRSKGEDEEDESDNEESEDGTDDAGSAKDDDDSSDSEDEDEDEDGKAKGVQSLIEIENPNRVQKKVQKVAKINVETKPAKPELSRREREEIEKQRAAAHYQKMHAEGKTDQARADLARLAIIKQHRAEAALRREQEKKEKEDRKKPTTSTR